MVAEIIVRLDDIDIVNLRRLQNFARRFRTGDVRTRTHRAPPAESGADAELRPQADNQGHTDQQQPMLILNRST